MPKPRILFLTSPEPGQANVHLAVIASFLERYGDQVQLHLASYGSLRPRAPMLVTFHTVVGKGVMERLLALDHPANDTKDVSNIYERPGFFGAIKSTIGVMECIHPESPEQYLATAQDVERILGEVEPTYVLVDSVFSAARDAVAAVYRKGEASMGLAMLRPLSLKDAAAGDQGAKIFGWPALGTGYPYPLPWYLYPFNVLNVIWQGLWLFLLDPKVKALNTARNAAGYPGGLPVFVGGPSTPNRTQPLQFCMSLPEAEIPAVIPSWLVPCGAIVQSSRPVSEVDPELYQWLMFRPTLLIVLGSHGTMPAHYARAMLQSLRVLLDKRKDIQVLWKLQKEGDFSLDGIDQVGERLKIVSWLDADPLAIMQTGNVICSINHGGANSYHEALLTGTPQVLLPAWYDCYDMAGRIEYNGVGKWGNKKAAPFCSEPELTAALLSVVGATPHAPEASKIRQRAKELSEIVGKRVGRDVVADRVWQEIQGMKGKSD